MRVFFFYLSRTFASETSQFLAPYEVSQKNRPALVSPTTKAPSTVSFTSEQNVQFTQTNSVRPNQLASSMSNSELCKSGLLSGSVGGGSTDIEPSVRKGIGKWNPFEDPTPFSQMTEDHIFDAEFDAIRQRGSQSSK